MAICAVAYSQTATYWPPARQSGFGGMVFDAPTVLRCRWEDSTETFTDNQGNEQASRSIVWTFDRLAEGGYLARGDRSATSDPTTLNDAFEIKRADEIPDLRGLNYERRSFL